MRNAVRTGGARPKERRRKGAGGRPSERAAKAGGRGTRVGQWRVATSQEGAARPCGQRGRLLNSQEGQRRTCFATSALYSASFSTAAISEALWGGGRWVLRGAGKGGETAEGKGAVGTAEEGQWGGRGKVNERQWEVRGNASARSTEGSGRTTKGSERIKERPAEGQRAVGGSKRRQQRTMALEAICLAFSAGI